MTNQASILLVEDDIALLEGMVDLLEISEIGYDISVLSATDGMEGLRVLADQTPNLVISDVMMPNMDGLTFIERVRENPNWVHIPFIFLTAKGTKQDLLEGRLKGADLYITKPYDTFELVQLVKSQLDRAFQLESSRKKRKDTMSRNIVQLLNHEFRTPLTYVTAYYEMLASGFLNEDEESIREYLRGIQVGAIRLSFLVDGLITVMELRTGQKDSEFETVAEPITDLSELIQITCDYVIRFNQSSSLEVHYDIPEALPPVYGARNDLKIVFSRLLDNALKFSLIERSRNPEIWITASAIGDEVRLSFRDNGVGFPPHVTKRLFELFYQHNRELFEQQGAGVGLTIAKGLVELHGGRIEVASAEGVGSTFTVVFPIFGDGSGVELAPEKSSEQKRKATILVVEDEWFLLEGLKDLLEILDGNYEFQIITATNGEEGLKRIAEQQPDLIISDIMMPRMDGYEFLENIRQNPAFLHIPVIFLTAKGEREDILRARQRGVEEYITKPYDSQVLFKLVLSQLDRYFQTQRVIAQNLDEIKRGILDLFLPDFQLPLMSVTDYAQLLVDSLEKVQSDEELIDYLRGIKIGSSQIRQMVEDFVFLVELDAGEASSNFGSRAKPGNVNQVIAEAIRKCILEMGEEGLEVTSKLSRTITPVALDYPTLRMGLDRVLKAAIMLGNGRKTKMLEIISKQQGSEVLIVIGSRGGELSQDKIDRINALMKMDGPTVLELSAFDPGLPVVKGIISLHRGQISLDSDPLGGYRFEITLPGYRMTPIKAFVQKEAY
jgi:CheY-like chemotaxis protein/anti-sigma regulatory factor (Ser/Thr protein kinase)